MKRLALVRHGETVWHAENRYAGSSDVALTAKGLEQAQVLGEWARGAELKAVWCSTLSRARRTAEPAAAAAGLPLRVDARLRELDFGRAEGMTSREMMAAFAAEREAFLADPVAHFLPDGEDPAAAAERGMAALNDIAASLADGERALVVAHHTLFRLLLCRSLGLGLSRYRTVFPKLGNTTLTELGFDGEEVALLCFNAPLILNKRETELHG